MEQKLNEAKLPEIEEISSLENELTRVIESIAIQEPMYAPLSITKDLFEELYNKLRPLLKSHNAKSLEYVAQLSTITETATLAKQIENFDFESASKTLEELKLIFED